MHTKRTRRLSLAAVIPLALLAVGCTEDEPAAPDLDSEAVPRPAFSQAESEATDQHVIVMGKKIPKGFTADVEALGGTVERTHPEIGVLTVSGLSDEAAATLAEMSAVEDISRDYMVQWVPDLEDMDVREAGAPSAAGDQSGASFFFGQWNLRQIDANDAWLVTNQGAGATVAILDTGIDPTHQDLAGRVDLANSTSLLTPGSSLCNSVLGLPDEETIFDFNFHGSFVAGIVSSNGLGMGSVAPVATLVGVKVLNCLGFGSFGDVNAGIMAAANAGVDVINMSLGALIPDIPALKALVKSQTRAVKFAHDAGVLVVASAGNDGINLDGSGLLAIPSQIKHVESIGATGPFNQMDFDQLAFYTNFGLTGVDHMAPGGNRQGGGSILDGILSICSGFSIFFPVCGTSPTFYLFGANGTSFAAPHAAGTAAVVESQCAGDQIGKRIRRSIRKGADDLGPSGIDPFYGRGRINTNGAGAVC